MDGEALDNFKLRIEIKCVSPFLQASKQVFVKLSLIGKPKPPIGMGGIITTFFTNRQAGQKSTF